MAGMFYSLKEVARKLKVSENEVKEMVKQGRLREFRDGPNLLFKVNEVEALMSDTSLREARRAKQESAGEEPMELAEEDEISLAPEERPTAPEPAGEPTSADTALTGEGIDILGETDSGYRATEDTMAQTKAAADEASLEEIEEDVSLDTLGSGSGLLDLSLQADDTSLGGILDEIYTTEAGEAEAPPAGQIDVGAEAGPTMPEAAAAPVAAVPVVRPLAEAEPDWLSNALGVMLFIPLVAVIFTVIAVVAGQRGIMPSVLAPVQRVILPVMGGFVAACGLVIGVSYMMAGKGAPGAARPKKAKVKKEESPKQRKKAGKEK